MIAEQIQRKIKTIMNNEHYTIYNGSMLDMLEIIEPNSIDSIVCDPPYELNFMGKGWDRTGIAFQPETWRKCYEVLKPGGYLLAFGGSRTFHRIAVAIEDAGFEIRDTIMWLYGSGFPKSMDIGLAIDKKNGAESKVVGKVYKGSSPLPGNHKGTWVDNQKDGEYEIKQAQNEWQGWGTCLKPAYEPVIMARKPFDTSVACNIAKYGVGGINIDECRIETEDYYHTEAKKTPCALGYQRKNKSMFTDKNESSMNENGRFPANIITDGSEEATKDMFDFETGANASRYFYTAKASKKDRDAGLVDFGASPVNDGCKKDIDNPFQRGITERHNIHPTVKPCELMQYLIRLVSPKGSVILDPFMGSGSTGKAAMFENRERKADYKFIGIEMTEEYLPIAKARIEYSLHEYQYELKKVEKETGQMNLFEDGK